VTRTASLPMYVFPALAAAHQALWDRLRAGLADAPGRLDLLRPAVPDRIGPEVLFTQVCGYPLFRRYRGQAAILGTPHYGLEGCDGPMHRAAFIVRAPDPASGLEAMRGRVFGCNSVHSNSGMNLPRLSLARIAGGAPFFARVAWTGGHLASLRALLAGDIDLCSVDCVTWGLARRHAPDLTSGLRVLDWTEPGPCLPFVTSVATSAAEAGALSAALDGVADPALSLQGVSHLAPAAYEVLADYETEARRLGYGSLA
jgi:ABC-type phosphate/phosphonate transport system substrate-binding protein